MPAVIQTEAFRDWLVALKDRRAAAKVLVRVSRLEAGNPGDVKPVGEGVSEARIDYGPGYRIYFATRGKMLIVLLVGGDKSTQDKDIKTAKAMWETWKEENDDED
jgi:putative addiction module killer protein